MKKDEILKRSRSENSRLDEMELYALSFAGKLASQVGMFVCCIVAILQVIFSDAVSYESWMIYFSINATIFLVKYSKLRRKHELLISILYIVLFVFFTVLFAIRLAG